MFFSYFYLINLIGHYYISVSFEDFHIFLSSIFYDSSYSIKYNDSILFIYHGSKLVGFAL